MELRDRDLVSIQEARELAAAASAAQQKFAKFSQEKVDAVVEAMARAAESAAETLARAAVEETGSVRRRFRSVLRNFEEPAGRRGGAARDPRDADGRDCPRG